MNYNLQGIALSPSVLECGYLIYNMNRAYSITKTLECLMVYTVNYYKKVGLNQSVPLRQL